MAVQGDQIGTNNQLLNWAFPAIARLEASLADEHEALRAAVNSANLLETLTNLGRVIADERERLDALGLIAPGRWGEEEFHSKVISWLLDPSAHHRQAGHFIAVLLKTTQLRRDCSPPTGAPPRFVRNGSTSPTDNWATWIS